MNKQSITVNKQEIEIVTDNGEQYVAIKPICTAIGVDYDMQDVSLSCNVCEQDIFRTAITVDGVKICHGCLQFLKMQAELNNRTLEKEIKYQANYINNTD